jgi:hypothetical protein
VFKKFHQPSVIETIKEGTDVSIKHLVHAIRKNSGVCSVQRIMLVFAWPVSIRKSDKICFEIFQDSCRIDLRSHPLTWPSSFVQAV